MERKLHLLESFDAHGSDGFVYKVRGYEHLVRNEALVPASDAWEPAGVAEYRLSDGQRVTVGVDGTMHIAGSEVKLIRRDSAMH